jgi:hypothetical protein
VDLDKIKRKFVDALRARAPCVAVVRGASVRPRGDFRARLRVAAAFDHGDEHGEDVARARVFIELEPAEGPDTVEPTLRAEGLAERVLALRSGTELGGGPSAAEQRSVALTQLIARLVAELTSDLAQQAALRAGAPALLIRALQGDDRDRKRYALRYAAARRLKATGDALLALLEDGDPDVRDGAMGALVALGDRRAVKRLTRRTRLNDPEEMGKVIDAIATLGGREAQSWLELVASGHDDAEVKTLASRALERMARPAPRP